MSKGLKELEKLRQYWNNKLPLSRPHALKIISTLEEELKDGDLIFKAMYHLEHEKNQHLSQANLKMSKALEILKNALCIHIFETLGGKYKMEVCVDIVGLTKDNYETLKEVLL